MVRSSTDDHWNCCEGEGTVKIKIKSFADGGDITKERVVLRVLADGDIGSYALFRSKEADDGGPLSGQKTAYWFPDKTVKSGDLLVVYTKKGKTSKKVLASGGTAHFFYWQLSEAIWGDDKQNLAVLFLISEWSSLSPRVTS